jgi:hypothetical protein
MDMKITGFMHVAQMGNWKEVLDEQIALVSGCGLAEKCDRVFVCLLGTEDVALPRPFEVLYHSPNLLFYEYETLSRIRSYCQNNDGMAWYIHTKGVSKTSEEWIRNEMFYKDVLKVDSLDRLQRNEREWRLYMQHFVIKKHNACIEVLGKNDVAGASWREEPCPHFSGNFWWARASYIRGLDDPYDFSDMVDTFGDKRGGAECWLGSGSPSAASFSNLRHNFYRWGVPPKDYLPLHL